MAVFDPSRLYVSLLNTGLQQKDNPLYQVIHDLIGVALGINNNVSKLISSGSGAAGPQGLQGIQGLPGLDSDIAGYDFIDPIPVWGANPIVSGITLPLGTNLSEHPTLVDTIFQVRGINPQAYWLFNTFTNINNYEAGGLRWNSNEFQLFSVPAGGGGSNRVMGLFSSSAINFYTASTAQWSIGINGELSQLNDNTADIGRVSSLRPRTIYAATSIYSPLLRAVVSAIGTTSTDGVISQNLTLSTAIVTVQRPPRIRLSGHVWNTTTPADNIDDWWIEPLLISGATPQSFLNFQHSFNGAAATTVMQLSAPASGFGSISLANVTLSGDLILTNAGFLLGSGVSGKFVFQNVAFNAGIGIDVSTAAVLKIRNTAQNADAAITFSSYTHSAAEIDTTYTVVVPVTGDTKTMAAGQSRIIFNPAGTLALLTVTLPPSPVDGQIAGMSFTQIITGLTINAPGGATVVAPPTTAAVDSNFRFLYQASSTSWFPCS